MARIPINEASAAQLRVFAQTVMNLPGIVPQHSAANIAAKIIAIDQNITHIDVPDDANEDAHSEPAGVAAGDVVVDGQNENHFSNDPKVEVTFARTSDVTKAKVVQIAVNGDTIAAKRGESVKIPYRHFLANLLAVETIGREGEEINPATGSPLMEFSDQPSYPMETVIMPRRADIVAWHKRMNSRPSAREMSMAPA